MNQIKPLMQPVSRNYTQPPLQQPSKITPISILSKIGIHFSGLLLAFSLVSCNVTIPPLLHNPHKQQLNSSTPFLHISVQKIPSNTQKASSDSSASQKTSRKKSPNAVITLHQSQSYPVIPLGSVSKLFLEIHLRRTQSPQKLQQPIPSDLLRKALQKLAIQEPGFPWNPTWNDLLRHESGLVENRHRQNPHALLPPQTLPFYSNANYALLYELILLSEPEFPGLPQTLEQLPGDPLPTGALLPFADSLPPGAGGFGIREELLSETLLWLHGQLETLQLTPYHFSPEHPQRFYQLGQTPSEVIVFVSDSSTHQVDLMVQSWNPDNPPTLPALSSRPVAEIPFPELAGHWIPLQQQKELTVSQLQADRPALLVQGLPESLLLPSVRTLNGWVNLPHGEENGGEEELATTLEELSGRYSVAKDPTGRLWMVNAELGLSWRKD
ncbi:MAG: hypothetical protein SFY68_06085 [Candidatus Sumerlaeia bacterium]|nr:hypothetical protein [Candidatus Sumerlaeia bacterium]